jgi:hypothetical protein
MCELGVRVGNGAKVIFGDRHRNYRLGTPSFLYKRGPTRNIGT